MSKCRYDLSADCHNGDCLSCTLDKLRAEIEEYRDSMLWSSKSLIKRKAINYILEQIIDKYRAESED